jgi:hypothetical protein
MSRSVFDRQDSYEERIRGAGTPFPEAENVRLQGFALAPASAFPCSSDSIVLSSASRVSVNRCKMIGFLFFNLLPLHVHGDQRQLLFQSYEYQRSSDPQPRYEKRILPVALPEAEKVFAQWVGFSARSASSRPISSAVIRSNSVTEFFSSILNAIGRFFAVISLAPRLCERPFQSP